MNITIYNFDYCEAIYSYDTQKWDYITDYDYLYKDRVYNAVDKSLEEITPSLIEEADRELAGIIDDINDEDEDECGYGARLESRTRKGKRLSVYIDPTASINFTYTR